MIKSGYYTNKIIKLGSYYEYKFNKQANIKIGYNTDKLIKLGLYYEEEFLKEAELMDWLQAGLDFAGFIPGWGSAFDAANASISLGRQDWMGAVLSFISAITGIGEPLSKAIKITEWIAKESIDVSKIM